MQCSYISNCSRHIRIIDAMTRSCTSLAGLTKLVAGTMMRLPCSMNSWTDIRRHCSLTRCNFGAGRCCFFAKTTTMQKSPTRMSFATATGLASMSNRYTNSDGHNSSWRRTKKAWCHFSNYLTARSAVSKSPKATTGLNNLAVQPRSSSKTRFAC